MFNQGIVVYQTIIPSIENTYVKLVVHDFALVYVGNKMIEVLDRTKYTNHGFTIRKDTIKQHGKKLRILVEASGHINFDKNMETDTKGIYYFGGDLKNNQDWVMYKFPIELESIRKWQPIKQRMIAEGQKIELSTEDFPILLTAEVKL